MTLRHKSLNIIALLIIIIINSQTLFSKGNQTQVAPVKKNLFPDEYSVLDSTNENIPKKNNWNIDKTLKSARADYYNALEAIQKGDTVKSAKLFENALSKLNPLASYPEIEENIAYIELLQQVIDDYEQFIRTTEYIGENTPFYIISDLYFDHSDKTDKQKNTSQQTAENIIIVEPGYIPPPDSMTINLTENEYVSRNIEFLLNPKLGLKTVHKWFERSSRWFPMFKKIAAEEGVPEELIYVSLIESGLMPNAISRASAVGIWQFVRSTAEMYGLNSKASIWIDERRDPEKSTRAAMKHFRDLFIDFGDWHLALAAYNCGKGCVERAMANSELENPNYWDIRSLLPKDTKNYIPSFIAVIKIFSNPKQYKINIDTLSYLDEFKYDVVHLDSAVNLSALAKAANISEDELKELNPEIIKTCTPPTGYDLKIPFGSLKIFNINFKQLSNEEKTPFFQHEVQKNETIAKIAKLYNISNEELISLNNLKSYKAKLTAGTFLRLPMAHFKNISEKNTSEENEIEEEYTPKNKESLMHYVRKGETLYSISQKYGINIDILKKLNSLTEEQSNNLKAGDSVIIAQRAIVNESTIKKISKPEKITHKVKKGETLSQIASLYNVTIEDICELNNIKDDVISVGQKLKIETNVKNKKDKKNNENENISNQQVKETKTPTNKAVVKNKVNSKGQTTHEVERGETLSTLAEKYGVTIDQIRALNPSEVNGDDIKAGSTLIIKDSKSKAKIITPKTTNTNPQATTTTSSKPTKEQKNTSHTVQKGDSFYSIAEKYGTTVEDLQKMNPKVKPEKIQIGQKIRVK